MEKLVIILHKVQRLRVLDMDDKVYKEDAVKLIKELMEEITNDELK